MRIRGILLVLFFVSALGAGVELLLLEHTETVWQLTPLILLGVGIVVAGAAALRPSRATLGVFQGVMGLFVLAGLTGLYLHYRGNVEFEVEMYPGLAGFDLFRKAMTGATPALAPGFMVQMGVLGFAWSLRHPGGGKVDERRAATDHG